MREKKSSLEKSHNRRLNAGRETNCCSHNNDEKIEKDFKRGPLRETKERRKKYI
jgi:hypothetical protein